MELVKYSQAHYTIEIAVNVVNEWGEAYDTCVYLGTDIVSTNRDAMILAAESLQEVINEHIAKHVAPDTLHPLAPNYIDIDHKSPFTLSGD